ncbi:Histidine kinase-, DNA gyrase B-, and HSP90-like ATPase [Cohnella sp. OV330]|uniref:sensor histidine kinase n=1 Tax=Cohnella sp. OV330 TaxID=1855288 RepID=UPI0008EEDCF0|nr:histidine kinase [Cohnella sp. OV330]SFB29410.1 Histidine kinase-, DNA gyrase B-, and HSP90-like ATPase [Cohnella sp. OV330]
MRFWNSLHTKFFLTYSLIVVAIILLVCMPMYVYLKNNIEKNTISRFDETASKIKDRLDERVNQFDVLSQLLYWSSISNDSPAVNYLNGLASSQDFYERYQLRGALKSFVTMLSTVYPDAVNIRLFTMEGDLISDSEDDPTSVGPYGQYEELKRIAATNGETLLSYESRDPWNTANAYPVFVFSRMLLPWETRAGMLEVMVKADELVDLETLRQIKGAQLNLFFGDAIIYSTDSGQKGLTQAQRQEYGRLKQLSSGEKYPFMAKSFGDKQYVFYKLNDPSDFSVMLTVPKKVVFASLVNFRNVAIAAMLLLILISVALFYILSRILTRPLKQLKRTIDRISLDESGEQLNMDNKYEMDEIHLINRSFRNMSERLKNSLEDTVRFRTLQLQAHFDMLQAQINPHFLFNMLGFIQSSAEDRNLNQVSALSQNLLGFFRYSISTQSPIITLEKELAFTIQYLELMKIRFVDKLRYRIEVDPMLTNLVVPKLILQPLVENSIQHGFNESTNSLEVVVSAYIESAHWIIQIEDNGVGITEQRLAAVIAKVEDYLKQMLSSAEGEGMSQGGMGVANSMGRLKFMFKDNFAYEIENREDVSGVRIRLRGPLRR